MFSVVSNRTGEGSAATLVCYGDDTSPYSRVFRIQAMPPWESMSRIWTEWNGKALHARINVELMGGTGGFARAWDELNAFYFAPLTFLVLGCAFND